MTVIEKVVVDITMLNSIYCTISLLTNSIWNTGNGSSRTNSFFGISRDSSNNYAYISLAFWHENYRVKLAQQYMHMPLATHMQTQSFACIHIYITRGIRDEFLLD